jgi:DNA-binding response OmpR family regulator
MKILLVDDDPEIRFIAGFLLREAGHDVAEAASAEAAADAMESVVPDVVLMDVLLGEDDGVAVAERLLAFAAPAPALIFLTGVVREEQISRLRAIHPAGIIQKPFDPATFSAQVAACLEGTP